jgi:UDP-2,3-diacylglucosamine pyrophosphatase LpxH
VARALVISDTHLGAWTGEDLLSQQRHLERLAPQLEGIDELVILGDLFDFLFGTLRGCFEAADGLVDLIAAKLAGKRLVFSAGNHDHHLVHRDEEDRLEARLAEGAAKAKGGPPGPDFFRAFLERRKPTFTGM